MKQLTLDQAGSRINRRLRQSVGFQRGIVAATFLLGGYIASESTDNSGTELFVGAAAAGTIMLEREAAKQHCTKSVEAYRTYRNGGQTQDQVTAETETSVQASNMAETYVATFVAPQVAGYLGEKLVHAATSGASDSITALPWIAINAGFVGAGFVFSESHANRQMDEYIRQLYAVDGFSTVIDDTPDFI